MALIPSGLKQVLEGLRSKFGGAAEDAYRDRDSVENRGRPERQAYAAGEAHAHSEDEASVQDAQDEADK